VGRTGRWLLAGLISMAAFAGAAWISGAVLLVPLLASSTDRWAVASGIGVSVAAFAAMWGQWWAGQVSPTAEEHVKTASGVTVVPNGTINIGRDNTGIASTGNEATNIQQP
jgi:hypothetical protein